MKKNLIISAIALAGGGLAAYIYRKYNANKTQTDNPVERHESRHLTNSFAKAKQHATGVV